MTDSKGIPGATVSHGEEGSGVMLPADLSAAYESMLARVPDAGGDVFDNILGAIAGADDASQLDAPWRSEGLEDYVGHRLEVRSIEKMPSGFSGGIPWYLIVRGVELDTGEAIVTTTSSISVVAQLAKAYALGAFPWKVTPVIPSRPSRAGYYPMHLEVIK